MPARRIGWGLVLVFFGLAGISTQAHALAICVDSRELAIQQSECIQRGSAVMKKYFEQVQNDAGAVFGFQGKDSAGAILCDRAAKGVVFFTVASTDNAVCRQNILRLKNDF